MDEGLAQAFVERLFVEEEYFFEVRRTCFHRSYVVDKRVLLKKKHLAVVFRVLIIRECVFEVEFTLFWLRRRVHQKINLLFRSRGCRFINSTWPYKFTFVRDPDTLKT